MQPTFDQASHLLSLVRGKGPSLENIQALYALGIISDVFGVEDPSRIDREAVRLALGYDPFVFRVKIGGPETTDEIVAHLKANGLNNVNPLITQANLPLLARPVVEEDEIVIHDPGTSFSENEGLTILKQEGLLRPTYEHGLRFAREHETATTSKKKPFVIFLHEHWLDPRRRCRVLYLDRSSDNRELDLYYPDGGFDVICVLAGVRPRKRSAA